MQRSTRNDTFYKPTFHKQRLLGLLFAALILFLAACSDVTKGPAEPALAPAACTQSWPLLQSGSRGTPVVSLQHLLNHHGAGLEADGSFGPQTLAAVEAFQRARGLGVDGKVGQQTWGALTGSVVLREGSRSEAVKAVQAAVGVSQDGVFGPQTKAAVISLQQRKGIATDGVVGPQTWTVAVGGSVTCDSGGGDRAELAQQILASSRVELWPYSPVSSGSSDGADARSNIEDTAAGRAAQRSSYQNAPGGSVYLDVRMLRGMISVANTYSVRVTSIAGGSHSVNSRHYSGIAFDIDRINGQGVSSSNPNYRNLESICRSAGATEVLGPGDAGHSSHIHCAWPR